MEGAKGRWLGTPIEHPSIFLTSIALAQAENSAEPCMLCFTNRLPQTMNGKGISYAVDPLMLFEPIPIMVTLKFRDLRLEALRADPPAYLSTFEREQEFSNAQWNEQILDPFRNYLICHTSLRSDRSTKDKITTTAEGWAEEEDWLGMLLLSGPYQKADYGATPLLANTALGSDDEETRWHLSALYLQSGSRCDESTIAIHEATLGYLRLWTDKHLDTVFDEATGLERPKRARLAGLLPTENYQLSALYEALAGKPVGWADRTLGQKIAGIDDITGQDLGTEPYMRVMERIIDC